MRIELAEISKLEPTSKCEPSWWRAGGVWCRQLRSLTRLEICAVWRESCCCRAKVSPRVVVYRRVDSCLTREKKLPEAAPKATAGESSQRRRGREIHQRSNSLLYTTFLERGWTRTSTNYKSDQILSVEMRQVLRANE